MSNGFGSFVLQHVEHLKTLRGCGSEPKPFYFQGTTVAGCVGDDSIKHNICGQFNNVLYVKLNW